MPSAEEIAQKRFDEEDRRWPGPKLVGLGALTLFLAVFAIYMMSTTTGCTLTVVP
jgi:hypothetical protein